MTPPNPAPEQKADTPNEVAALKETLAKQTEATQALQHQLTSLTQTMNSTLEKLTKAPGGAEPQKQDPTAELWKDFEYGADVKNAVERTVETKLTESEDRVLNRWDQQQLIRDKKKNLDNKAVSDYPQLLQENHPLRQEYLRIYAAKLDENPDYEKNPSAVYDAANIAYANLVRQGKIIPTEFTDEIRRLMSVNDSTMMPINGRPPSKPEELTTSQKFFIQRLRVDPKKYVERANLRR